MQYPQRMQICNALKHEAFDGVVLNTYLETSSYHKKKSFAETINSCEQLGRYFTPVHLVTAHQKNNFWDICQLELEYCVSQVKAPEVSDYLKLIDIRQHAADFDAARLADKLLRQKERKLMLAETGTLSKTEAALFLKAAMLFSDNSVYDMQQKAGLTRLCEYVAAK